jgi:hypothetical protein
VVNCTPLWGQLTIADERTGAYPIDDSILCVIVAPQVTSVISPAIKRRRLDTSVCPSKVLPIEGAPGTYRVTIESGIRPHKNRIVLLEGMPFPISAANR